MHQGAIVNAEEIRTKLSQEFLSVTDVAEILGVDYVSVVRWYDAGHLEGVNIAPPSSSRRKRLLRIKSRSVQKLLGIDDLAEV
jgi:transposase